MKDIGFGLIDRRTVIIVLFTLVLANILFGYQIPVDIQNVGNLFIGLVVLTGYIYLARTIYRLPVALFVSIIINIEIFRDKMDEDESQASVQNGNTLLKKFEEFIRNSIRGVILLIIKLPFFMISLLYLILTFGENIEKERGLISSMPRAVSNFYYRNRSSAEAIRAFFGILDRIGVVCIAAIATIPYFSNLVKIIGVSGLLAMVTIFTLRGDFTALIKDVLETKGEDDKKVKEKNAFDDDEPSINVKNSLSNPIYVEVVNTNARPLEIKNFQHVPLYIAVDYDNPLMVRIANGTGDACPVYVVNAIKTQQDDD